ncbi:MAG TPA: hypothetical protein VJT09_10285 [Pyrinomonadaceae bacterium]|nr:hypothetical protein [Pyrinomonadaceae bacterium]
MDMTVARAFAAAAILAVATATLYSYGQQLVESQDHAEANSGHFTMYDCAGPNPLRQAMVWVEGLSIFWATLAAVAGVTVFLGGVSSQPARRSILGLEEIAARRTVAVQADGLTPLERVIRDC